MAKRFGDFKKIRVWHNAGYGRRRGLVGANTILPGTADLKKLLPNLLHEISTDMKKTHPARTAEVVGRCRLCGHVFMSNRGRYGLGADSTCTSKTACAKRRELPKGDECYECDHRHLGSKCKARGCDCQQWTYGPL